MLVAKIVFWVSLAALVWTHVGYALAAALAARVRRRRVQASEIEPSVSIVVAAHNESDVIERRVRNLLDLDYPPDLIEVVVASDASTDGTNEVVERLAAADSRVKLVRCERGGKVAAQNRGVGESDAVRSSRSPTRMRSGSGTRCGSSFAASPIRPSATSRVARRTRRRTGRTAKAPTGGSSSGCVRRSRDSGRSRPATGPSMPCAARTGSTSSRGAATTWACRT